MHGGAANEPTRERTARLLVALGFRALIVVWGMVAHKLWARTHRHRRVQLWIYKVVPTTIALGTWGPHATDVARQMICSMNKDVYRPNSMNLQKRLVSQLRQRLQAVTPCCCIFNT